jgi:preprotein translocase subunit SecD
VTDLELVLRDALGEAADLVPVSPHALSDYGNRRAKPTHRRRTVALSMAGIAAATAGIVLGAVLLGTGGKHVDTLRYTGGQTLVLTPATPQSAAALSQSATILSGRLTALGVKHVSVVITGTTLTASVPRADLNLLRTTAATRGTLRFRQVLSWGGGSEVGKGRGPLIHPVVEAATLSSDLDLSFTDWPCLTHPNPNGGNDKAGYYVVACDAPPETSGSIKYLLAPSAIDNTGVATATPGHDATNQWVVNLSFDKSGSTSWRVLTAKAYSVDGGQPQVGTATGVDCAPPKGCNAIAITVDGAVVSAPFVETAGGLNGGQTQISGNVTKQTARQLAAVLSQPPLPTTFATTSP